MKSKSENLAQILGGQNWAVTNLPHLQESCPEIPRVEKERDRGRNTTTLVFNDILDTMLLVHKHVNFKGEPPVMN